jgi:indole-3-glycerol phosphate synthase
MDALVEIHSRDELLSALDAGAECVGINNRNLMTFHVDMKTSERLIPEIPQDKLIVSESGFKTKNDIDRVKDMGAHAVLIGETFMLADDIGAKIEEVFYGKG